MEASTKAILIGRCRSFLVGPLCPYDLKPGQAGSLLACLQALPDSSVTEADASEEAVAGLVCAFFDEDYKNLRVAYRDHFAAWPS